MCESPSPSTRISARVANGKNKNRRFAIASAIALAWSALVVLPAAAQQAGQNVNMVTAGTSWTNGDPFRERQNEPSMAVSTRNSAHIVAAANDYRTVDIPGVLGIDARGDAWIGLFKSFDGGLTWRSTLMPGFPLDSSPQGFASPLHGRQAAADPVVRAGTNGLFYVAGIAFDRGTNPLSRVFVMRLADLNNKENGDAAAENGSPTNLAPRDTIKYVDTNVVDTGTSSRFLDKPWMAVDIPRAGHGTCTVNANEDGTVVTQKVPAGAIYMTYTAFTTIGTVTNSQILFRRSMNCGVTWSKPIVLSSSDDPAGVQDSEGQGTVIAIDPSVPAGFPARIYVAWRVFAEPGDPDDPGSIMIAKSVDGGQSFDEPEPAVTFPLSCNTAPTGVGCPFDQPQTGTTFRSNGYPALTVDNYGRIYLAWSQRDVNGDGRIFLTTSYLAGFWPKINFKEIDPGAIYDDNGNTFGNLNSRGSQLMPTLNFNSGKLILTYYDLRQDHTSGQLTALPEPPCDPTVTPLCPLGNPFSEMRQFEGELLTNPGAVFNAYINDATLTVRRHTLDIVGSEASPNVNPLNIGLPNFTHFRVSRYQYGVIPPDTGVEQGQFNAPNLPMFVQGTAPFMGDYIDVAGTPSMVLDPVKGWIFNTSPSASPVFHSVWTDNRDVQPPPDGISWNKYTPPTSTNIGGTSKFDPAQTPPACISGYSGMRDQNIYTSTISQGLILTSPQTEKPVLQTNGQPIQRQFVVIMRNESNLSRTFQVSIPAQPASAQASFLQFSLVNSITVAIPAFSTASRAVFLTPKPGSTVAFPQFQVNAAETDGAKSPLSASILFNADPTNPFLASPDDASFGGSTISSQEFYNPAVLNPAALNPAALNPAVLNPAVLNPAALNPAVLNPAALNPSALNPNFVVALNPAALNATIENPAVLNNAVANPAVLNPAALNTPVSDANYTVTNEGNTSATYQLQLFQSGNLPPGSVFQIILTKTYLTPGVSPLDGCTFGGQVNNEVVASIDNPAFVTNPSQLGNPAALNGAINNTTYALAPGDTLQITLRANLTVDDLATLVLPNLTPVVASQAVNTVDVQNGVTTPPITLLVTTATVPVAVAVPGQQYSTTLVALGGNPPQSADTWQLIGGSLPPGLNLSTSGVISGTATAPGNYTFTIQVIDTGTPQHTAIRTLSMTVVAPVSIVTPPLPNATLNLPYTESFTAQGGLVPITWSSTGTLPPGLTFTSAGLLSGTPTALGTFNFNVTATDSLGLFQTAPYSVTVTNVVAQFPATVTFVVQPSNTVGAQPISPAVQVQVLDVTGAAIANTQVVMNFGNPACSTALLSGSPLATTAANGIATFGNLLIDHGQNNFTLLATAGNAFATSNPFNIEGFCETAGMNTARHNHIVLGLPNGTVLVTGGAVNSDNTGALASAELYNTSTHTWTTLPNMSVARLDHTMTLLNNGTVLIAGGFNDTGITNTLELFDPATNTFTLLPATMSSSRAEHEATLLANGKVLLTGGNASQTITSNTADIFDPSTNTVTPSAHTMSTTRQIHHADLLPNGLVLVNGGFDQNNNPLASAELYDPIADTFTLTGSMATARGNHGSALLYNGKVLVAGGLALVNGVVATTATAELYDPSAGTFSPTGGMSIPRGHYAPPTLVDGTVFFEGGATLPAGTNADIYNPATGTFRVTSNITAAGQQTGMRDAIQSDGTVLLASGVNTNIAPVPNSEVFYPLSLPTGITITTSGLPNATQDKPYTQLFQEFGGVGNLTYSLATGTLPSGMTLSTSGVLTGTPTSAGTFTFAVSVQDSANPPKTENTSLLTLVVSGVPLQFTSNTVPGAGAGRFYSQALPIIGGVLPYTVTQTGGTLPPGLSVSSTGVLEGTPSAAGSFTFTVQAVDSSATHQTATQTFTVTVDTLFITTTVLPNGVVGAPYNAPISTSGGTLPLSFSLATAAFPPGLLIQQPAANSQTGALAGTPTLAGTFEFSESVTDSSNPRQTATQNYVVTIAPIGAAVPAHVSFAAQPQSSIGRQTLAGSPLVVSVSDANNTPIASAVVALSFNGAPPCASAILSGTLEAVTGANGQATFSNLSVDRGQFGYTLLASAGTASAVSAPFSVQGFCESGNLSVEREFPAQSLLGNGKVLIAGGVDNANNALNTAELYDPATGTTSPTGNLSDPNGRVYQVSVVLPNGQVLLAGGENNVALLSSAELYNPATGTFTPAGSMSEPRFLAEAVLLADGRVLVTGGFNTNVALNTAEIYDPATGLFTRTGNMNQGRGRHTMTLLPNGKVLVTGGRDAALNFFGLASAEIFDPSANQGVGAFTSIGNMNSPRFVHTATLLTNGTVLIAGGFNAGTESLSVTSAEIFDPIKNSFTLTGSMNIARARFTATLLPDGTVLMAGGINSVQGVAAPAPSEIYSPATGTFAFTGAMITGRELLRATELFNGNVLVTGGDDGVNVLPSTEIYYNTVPIAPIEIVTTTIPNAIVGQPYTAIALEQNGTGPITWSIISGTLPSGIKGNNIGTYGVIVGTPTTAGSFTFTAQVTDGHTVATRSFTINVSIATLAFTSNTMPSGGVGRAYSQTLPVTGGTPPYTATVTTGNLPPGLSLSSGGVLVGTPTSAGSFTFTVNITDSSAPVQSATQTLTMAVDTLFITTTALPDAIVGAPYSVAISAAGGTLPLTFSAVTAAFPPGLTIQQPASNSRTGALIGTPTAAGHFTFFESVVDSSNPTQTATQYYTMDVLPAGVSAIPATVTFLSQPQNSVGGQILAGSPIRVHVVDANNAPVSGASVALSFNGAPPCSSAVLNGTLTAITGTGGNALFPDLSIDRGQLGYTLLASTGNIAIAAVSQPFTVNGFCDTGSMATPRALLNSVTLHNGKVLIAGGAPAFNNQAVAFSSAELYDPMAHSFAPVGSMHTGRSSVTLAVLQSGLVLVAGGNSGSGFLSSAELFDPATNTFTLLPGSMVTARELGVATLLANGKVLITGGVGNGASALASAEIFDPATNTFTATSQPMSTPRWFHAAALLPNGKVLITGGAAVFGATGPNNSLASAEIYDPVTDTFTSTGSMASARYEQASALLFTGKVFVSGGFAGDNFTVPSGNAELYDPSTGTFSSTQASAGSLYPVPVLPDGTVFLFTGGNAQIYDPAAGTVHGTGNTTTIQGQPETALLNDGTILVAGGVGSPTFNTGIANAEIYYSTAPFGPLAITSPITLPSGVTGQPYTQMLFEQGGVGPMTWTPASGTLPSGITLRSDGFLIGTPTSSGTFTFAVHLVDSSTPQKSLTSSNFTLVVKAPAPPLNFPAETLNTGVTGVAYSTLALTATGGTTPYIFAVTGGTLPAGVTLSSGGVFGSTPTTVGTFSFTVTVTDSSALAQSVSQSFTIQVTNPLAITTLTLPNGTAGTPYTAGISSSGGLQPASFSVTSGTLPTGLTLASKGALTGTPTIPNTFTFTLTATDGSTPTQSASQSYTVTIAPITIGPPATINFVTQPTSTTAGQPISPSVQLKVTDGNSNGVPGVTVTLGAGSGQNRPILSGTLSAITDASGIATFSNVILDRAGTGFILLASASGVSSSGAVQLVSVPASVQQGATESDTQIQMFSENLGLSLPTSVAADITAPGAYASAAGLTSGSIASGTKVDSYYLHSDPIGISRIVTQLQAGEVTFPTDVLGVAVLDPELTASDSTLGLSSVSYPPSGRALALASPTDTVILSADRRTVTLHLSGMNATKDVRVITAANSNTALGSVSSAAFNAVAAPGSISTVAGSTWVFPGAGLAIAAPLGLGADFIGARMSSVADASGNLYIADPNNQMVFKLSGSALSIVAGTGVEGYSGDGGPATQARLDFPAAVALSSSGELYIADEGNSVIRKVNTSGLITTVAGNGVSGYSGDGGPATSASLNAPGGINFDAAGNLLIADSFNAVIRKVDTAGQISTVPVTTPTGLFAPEDVVVGPGGVLFIADSSRQQILRLDSGGNLTPVAGTDSTPGYSGDGGPATSALLDNPTAIAFDGGGNLYIADEENAVVRKVDTTGTITTVVGQGEPGFAGDGGPATLALLAQPGGLSFDSTGNLFISDTTNERIRKVDTSGTITTVAGNGRFKYAGDGGQATSASLDSPTAVALVPSGNLFAADIANGVVREMVLSGQITTYAGTGVLAPTYSGDGGPASAANIAYPYDVQADVGGNLYVSEGGRIHKITPSGTITTLLSGGATNANLFASRLFGAFNAGIVTNAHIAVDSMGNLYVADGVSVLKLSTTGAVSILAGHNGTGFSGDGGPATSAKLSFTMGLAVDLAGNIFIADQNNHRIRKVDTGGIITTVAGNGSSTNSGNGGPATSAGIGNPYAVAVDGGGNLYIGTAGVVRRVDTTGTITTIVGGGFIGSSVDGIPATNAALTNVQGLAFDAAGNLYLSDRFNDRIRKVTGVTNTPPFIFNVPTALTVTTKGLPMGKLGIPYFQTVSAVGGTSPYAWSAVSGALPTGLNLSSTGQISGTPTGTGAFTFVAQVTDSLGAMATQSLTITINTPFALAPQTLPTGIVGSTYTASLIPSGGTTPYSFSLTSGVLPAGISLSTSGGFSGIPTATGTFSFAVLVKDSSLPFQTSSQSFTIQVTSPLAITTLTLPNGTVGTPYAAGISSNGGLQPAGFAITSGTLPTGFTLASNGSITGTPTVASTFTFTITATDGSTPPQTASQSYTVMIAPAVVPASVVFTTEPANSTGGQFLNPGPLTVLVFDALSNPLPNVVVTMSFNGAPPCSNAILGGTLTQTTNASGIATFSDLMIDRGQLGYTLLANAGTASAVSQAFIINGFCPTGNLSAARESHTQVLVNNGKVLIAGGNNNSNNALSTAELFDPAIGTVSATGNLSAPSGRTNQVSIVLPDGKVLLAGGFDSSGTPLSSAELYDPVAGTFSPTGSMAQPRVDHAGALLADGRVLISGGSNQLGLLNSAEIFDPATGLFTQTGNLNQARSGHTITLLPNGTVLVAGGQGPGVFLSTAEIFDPTANQGIGVFTLTGSLNLSRSGARATLLPNGTVLIAGGVTFSGVTVNTNTAEIFDPVTGLFTLTGNMNSQRREYAATSLPDGSVLVSGGCCETSGISATAEIYDPVKRAFSPTGSMSAAREVQGSTLLNNGTVLVAGGDDGTNELSSADIYYSTASITPLTFPFILLANANQNQPYTQLLLQQGGVGTLTWALTNTSAPLPTGLTLSSNGILSGTPTVFGGFAFTVSVTDSSTPPKTATNTYALVVNPAFQLFSQMTTAFSGVAYSDTLPILGGTAPYTSTQVGGILPAGLNFAGSTNTVSGTTTALGSYPLTFQVTDSSNPPQTITQTTTLAVITPLAITPTTLPNGALNTSYSAVINTTGGLAPVIIGPTSAMPPGLTMNTQGVISGSPTQTGTFTFSVAAIDAAFPPETIQATLSITVNASVSPIQLSPNPLNLLANNTGTMTATLASPAGAGGVLVTLSSSSAAASVPANVTVPATQSSIGFQVTAGPAAGTATITASATGDTHGNASVVVTTRPMVLTIDGPLLAVNRSFNATIILAQPVPSGGSVTVTLTSGTAGVVAISPATQTITAGGTTAVFTLTAGATGGSTLLTATAPGYTDATAPLTVTSNQISFGAIPTLAPGQTASLPVSLSFAAPPGGLTINFSSANPSIATITPSVFVPAGLLIPAANPQVTGVTIGSTSFSATATGFAPDTGGVTVTVTGTVSPNPASFAATRTQVETITISAAAPAGGITFSLVSDTPSVATVPATATVPAGQLTTSFTITGVAQGNANINVTSTGIAPNIVPVTINAPPAISIGAVTIGNNMIASVGANLTVAPLVNQLMTLTSNDPTHFLLTNDPTKVGTASITVQLTAGTTGVPTFYVEGQNYSGVIDITSTITASATGYTSANPALNLYPSGLTYLFTSALDTTTFSSPTVLTVYFVILNPGTLTLYTYGYNLGPQAPAPVPVNITSTTPSVGTITSGGSATIPIGSYFTQTLSFQPGAAGTTNLNLATPSGYSTPANYPVQTVATVSAPAININSTVVGNNMITGLGLSLGAAPPSAETLTVTSPDPTHFLLTTDPTKVGTASINLPLTAGSTSVPIFYVEGQNYTGTTAITTTLTASAPGYAASIGGGTSLYPSGLTYLFTSALNTTTFSSPSLLTVYLAILNPGTLSLYTYGYNLGPQASPIPVSLTDSVSATGTLSGNPSSIPVGSYFTQGISFQPVSAGTTNLTIATPSGYSTPSNYPVLILATVTAPVITINNAVVGNNMIIGMGGSLGAAPPTTETLTITSPDPTHFLLTTDPTKVGTASINLTLTAGSAAFPTFYVEGQNFSGSTSINASLSASAPGYTMALGSGAMNLYPSGVTYLFTSTINTTTFSQPTGITAYLAILSPGTLNLYTYGYNLGPQAGAIPISITDTNTSVGTLTGNPASIPVGAYFTQGIAFHPATAGTTNLNLATPSGYSVPANQPVQIVATVTAPSISVSNLVVGNGLVTQGGLTLAAAPPSNESLTITSTDPTHFLLTSDPTKVGTASITLQLTGGSTAVPAFYVEGQNFSGPIAIAATLTVSAAGFSDGNATMSLYPSGLTYLFTNTLSTTATSGPSPLTVYVVILNPGNLNLYTYGYPVGPQTGSIPVAITSTNTSVGTISGSPAAITIGNYFTQAISFVPVASGTTNLNLATPTGYFTPTNYPVQIVATVQ